MTASSASRTPTRARRTWPSVCAWKVKLSCDGQVAYGFAHRGGLAPENAMTCKGWASVTSERTCRSYQVLVPELGSLVCRWPDFGYVGCLPAGPQATITPLAVLLTDATWYGVPCQTPTTSMSLGMREREPPGRPGGSAPGVPSRPGAGGRAGVSLARR